MNIEHGIHTGFNPEANVYEDTDGDVVPLADQGTGFTDEMRLKVRKRLEREERDAPYEKLMADQAPHVDTSHYVPEAVDRLADQGFSYAEARRMTGEAEPHGDFSASAMEARLDERTGVPMVPKGKSTGRYVSGPQLGEEVAPHVDQRVPAEQQKVIKERIAPIVQSLGEKAVERVRKNAVATGVDPDAAEQAYHERRPRS